MATYHVDAAAAHPTGKKIGGLAVYPLRQTVKGTTRGVAPVTNQDDIIDLTLDLFKANIFFKSYDVETDEDRVLVYLTLYAVECLKKMQKTPNKERALQDMYSFALQQFSLPGDTGFPLNAFFIKPNRNETDELKLYMTQLRQEAGARLVERVFDPNLSQDGKPSKWWTCFAKRKFLNQTLAKTF